MAAKSINTKIDELNTKVEWFYGDDFKLESASANYRAAVKLAKEIESDLINLKNEIKQIETDLSKE